MAENAVRIDGTVPITGSVTSTPSGTQNVSIVSSSATVAVSDGAGSLTVDGTVNAIPAPPAGSLFYALGLVDVPGVVAANTFISFFNPAASGKTLAFYNGNVLAWAGGATTVAISMRANRISAASGGTLISPGAVAKFSTAQANPVTEVRTGNPTTTVTQLLFGIPPVITTAGAGASVSGTPGPTPSTAAFLCAPGEGVSLSTSAGDVDQLWNFHVIWAEL